MNWMLTSSVRLSVEDYFINWFIEDYFMGSCHQLAFGRPMLIEDYFIQQMFIVIDASILGKLTSQINIRWVHQFNGA